MVGEQAALRRVATLVARGVSEEEVFTTVAEEAGRLLSVAVTGLFRFESDETVTLVGGWGQFGDVVQVGLRVPLGRVDVASQVARTGKFARLAPGVNGIDPPAVNVRPAQLREVAGSPIVAAGRVWGTLVAESVEGGPLPRDVEQRLTEFAELVAIATANSKARVELARLANEQAALRRIATLVAKEAPAEDLFAQVAEDVANLLGPEVESAIFRYEPDDTVTCLAVRGEQVPGGVRVGSKVPVGGDNATARVYRERRPVRFDDYSTASGVIADRAKRHGFLAAIGCPILVQGRLWGMIFVAHGVPEPFPLDTEQRLTRFTELLATAIANTEAHAEFARLANEQAALRRVATQVARETPTTELFAKVAEEVANLLGSQVDSAIVRYEPGETVTLMALQTQLPPGRLQVGMRLAIGASDVTTRVYRDRRPVRADYHDGLLGAMAEYIRDHHISTTIGCPILVQGRLWGAMIVSQTQPEPFPADTEQRITQFTALVATAIANADSRTQLTASRARVLSAADEARRRVVRDLHDGAQQRLVHTIITLKLAQRAFDQDPRRARSLLSEALEQAEHGNADLRELAHGILPSVLARGGLRAGVDSVVARLDVPVEVEVTSARLPPEIEASGYFIIAEALTNVVKHARATKTTVRVTISDSTVQIEVRDDGVGGADTEGDGLTGLSDRVAALGGSLRIDSPDGRGTALIAQLPVPV